MNLLVNTHNNILSTFLKGQAYDKMDIDSINLDMINPGTIWKAGHWTLDKAGQIFDSEHKMKRWGDGALMEQTERGKPHSLSPLTFPKPPNINNK